MRALFLLLALSFPAQALAQALLRPHAVVHGATVLLSEIFVGASDVVAMAAPGPGRRFVLEAAQVAQIARANGLAWRPSPGAERIVVERPGRLLARATAEEALREVLAPLGAGAQDGFDFAAPLPMVASGMEPVVTAEDPVFDSASGRFSATLVIDSGDARPQRHRMVGRAWPGVLAVVPTRRLASSEVLRAENLRLDRVRADRAGAALSDPRDAVGLVARRPIAAGQPLLATDLGRAPVVLKNSAVMMAIEVPGMTITAQARAMEDGAPGEVIRVQNVASRAVVEAQVVGAGRVRVGPGSMPVEPPARAAAPSRR